MTQSIQELSPSHLELWFGTLAPQIVAYLKKTHLIWNKKSVKKSPFKKNVVKSIFGIEVGFTLKPFLYPDTKTIL